MILRGGDFFKIRKFVGRTKERQRRSSGILRRFTIAGAAPLRRLGPAYTKITPSPSRSVLMKRLGKPQHILFSKPF